MLFEHFVQRGHGIHQRDAAAGDDAFFHRGAGGAQGVLEAVLLLFQLGLGGGADFDFGHAAGELGQALLQLLAVVGGLGGLDGAADLLDAPFHLRGVAGAFHDGGVILGDGDFARAAQHVGGHVLQLQAEVFGDELAAGEDGDVFQHGLAAIAEARALSPRRLAARHGCG